MTSATPKCGIRLPALAAMMLLLAAPVAAQRPARRAAAVPAAPRAAAAAVKGIWEPVSYGEDLELTSVFFVTPEIGWVSGAAGTILKTTDGGAHWTAQLGGDPGGSANTIRDLQFIDGTHGFAAQPANGDNILLQTTDGEHWRAHGTVPQHRGGYLFISPRVGFASANNEIRRTNDGGLTWRRVLECGLKVSVGGVTRSAVCSVGNFSFPTPEVGYALAESSDVPGAFLVRTGDGGATWTVTLPMPEGHSGGAKLVFTDATHGTACMWGGTVMQTADGGATWDGAAGVTCSGTRGVHFADPEVGWILGTRDWLYTTDGGGTWRSRAITFPAEISGFSMPRRDVAFAVGDHGLVYRYHLVPAGYHAPSSIDAPAMPGIARAVGERVDRAETQLETLGTALNNAPETGAAAAGAGGFAQRCCGGAAAPVGTSLGAVATEIPAFLGNYRNVNLVLAGLRLVGALSSQLAAVQQGYDALRHAGTRAAALTAVADLSAALQGLDGAVKQSLLDEPPMLDDGAVADGGSSSSLAPSADAAATDNAAAGSAPAAAPAKKGRTINVHVKLPKF